MLCAALPPYPVQYSLHVADFQLVENILHQHAVYTVYHKLPKVIFLKYCLGIEGFQQVQKNKEGIMTALKNVDLNDANLP